MVNLNWVQWRIAAELTTQPGYVILPAFSYDSLVWLGRSELVTQFNFSMSKRWSIPTPPDKPTDCNFLLCVRYRIGTRVFRYKIWECADAALEAPAYNQQIIGPNAVFEAWSTESSTSVDLEDAITITSSIRQLVTDFSAVPAPYEETTMTEAVASTVSVALPATLPMDFGAAGAWLDNDECECGCQPLGDSTAPEDATADEAILDAQGNAILDADGNAILQP